MPLGKGFRSMRDASVFRDIFRRASKIERQKVMKDVHGKGAGKLPNVQNNFGMNSLGQTQVSQKDLCKQ